MSDRIFGLPHLKNDQNNGKKFRFRHPLSAGWRSDLQFQIDHQHRRNFSPTSAHHRVAKRSRKHHLKNSKNPERSSEYLEKLEAGSKLKVIEIMNCESGNIQSDANLSMKTSDEVIATKIKMKDARLPATSKKKFTCHLCPKEFLRKFSLTRHVLIHSGERPYKCTYCPKGFNQGGDLRRHLTMHTGEKNFQCKLCFDRFNTQKNLKYHLTSHSSARPFHCQHCQKSFKVKRLLNFHQNLHNPEKRFKCESCESRFVTKSYLKSHMIVHATERPYNCDLCLMKFKRTYDLTLHQRRHHGISNKRIKREPMEFDHVLVSGGIKTEIVDLMDFGIDVKSEKFDDEFGVRIGAIKIDTEIIELSD